MVLNSKLGFNQHLDDKINRCKKIIRIMKKNSMTLSKKKLAIYKSFVRPLLCYADIIYDKPVNESFKRKLEAVQYNASLFITSAKTGTSRERLYHDIGLEFLSDGKWSRKFFFFHKVVKRFSTWYLQEILSCHNEPSYETRSKSVNNIEQVRARVNTFESSYFPHCTKVWFKLSEDIHKIIKKFKKVILDFIRPKEISVYAILDISIL